MSGKVESRDGVRMWSLGGILVSLIFIAILHLQVTRLLPEVVNEWYIFSKRILPISWEMRYIFRTLLIFSCAYSSTAVSVVFKEPEPYGIWYFGLGAAMLLYGYMPDISWYNAFVYPLTPFVVWLNAKHLPLVNFKRKTKEFYYNNYNRKKKEGSIEFPLQKTREKSAVDKKADFSKSLVLPEPDETTIAEAGTGKGKSRALISHYIESCIKNGWNVVIHDYKGNPFNPKEPELTKFALDAAKRNKVYYDLNMIGFTDPGYTKQCNLYDPYAITSTQDVTSVNETLMFSLNKSWAKDQGADPFWKDNAISLINGITLTAQKYRPNCLTLPHLVAMSVRDTEEILDAFIKVPDPSIKMYLQSFKNSYEMAKETAGSIISSMQIPLVNLNDKHMFWTFSGNQDADDDFFTLNFASENPFILSVCNNATKRIHRHGVNTYLTTILSRLRDATNRPTALILDEFDQIYVNDLDGAIATVRSAGTKIVLVLQTYQQLAERMGKPYADKIMDLGQNKIKGGGGSGASAREFVDNYVPDYQDLEKSVNQSGSNDDSTGLRTADKKVIKQHEITGQEKFHFTGSLSTGNPNTFFNLPFKVNPLDMASIEIPMMNKKLEAKYQTFLDMMKVSSEGEEANVSKEEADVAYEAYKEKLLEKNAERIFKEANEFIDDLKHGAIS